MFGVKPFVELLVATVNLLLLFTDHADRWVYRLLAQLVQLFWSKGVGRVVFLLRFEELKVQVYYYECGAQQDY